MSMTSTVSQPPLSLMAISFGVITACFWGLWPVISRFSMLQTLSAADLVAIRFWVSGLILVPFLIKHGLGGLSWSRALFLTVTGGVLYVSIALYGLNYAPSSHAGMVIPSGTLTFTLLGGWWILKDRPSYQRVIGIAVVIAGIVLISQATGGQLYTPDNWKGHALFIAAGLCWASFTIATRQAGLSALHVTAIVSVLSMLIYTPIYFLAGNPTILQAATSDILIQVVFQGVVNSILALYTYSKTIELLGAGRASLFVSLVPGMSMLIAFPLLGEQPGWPELLGLVIITAGMVLALRAK